MADIFDNTIICKDCNIEMKKAKIIKNGFAVRFVICQGCQEKIVHPTDEIEYNKYKELKSKEFNVKMRIVGNSYTISIPKEIVSFMNDRERILDDMVKLCFEDMGRLSLRFHRFEDRQ